jgi:hypothetical protein
MPVLPLKTYIDIAAGLIVALFCAWVCRHFYMMGENAIRAADAKVVAAQKVHNDEVNTQVASKLAAALAVYKAQYAASPIAPVHVSVCNITSSSPFPADEPAAPGSNAKASVPPAVGPVRDIGPATDKLLEQADAQVTLLQAYVQTCIDKGICRGQ